MHSCMFVCNLECVKYVQPNDEENYMMNKLPPRVGVESVRVCMHLCVWENKEIL